MAKEKRYRDGIRIARSVGETGKTIVKIKTYFIVGLVLILLIVIGVVAIQLTGFDPFSTETDAGYGTGELPNHEPFFDEQSPDPPPVLDPIIPNVITSIDGKVVLSWESEDEIVWFKIWRIREGEQWNPIRIDLFRDTSYTDTLTENGEYRYTIMSYIFGFVLPHESHYSNVQSVTAYMHPLPTNPSIIINDDGSPDGANATNSLEVILTLSCNDADKMRFQIKSDYWTDYVDYTTTYPITLFEDDPESPNYRVGVEFYNQYGTIETWDGIIYDPDAIDYEDEDEDYILLAVVLIAVLGGLIGIVVFLKFRKKGKKSKF